MAKDGYLIFDSDTHVGPPMEVLEPYLSRPEIAALAPYAAHRRQRSGASVYAIGERHYDRVLGQAESEAEGLLRQKGHAAVGGALRGPEPEKVDFDVAVRLNDLDFEGTDTNLM
ncbi:MAG: hypothetical protein ACHQ7M_16420, partial [Chloroflexota bacterium]